MARTYRYLTYPERTKSPAPKQQNRLWLAYFTTARVLEPKEMQSYEELLGGMRGEAAGAKPQAKSPEAIQAEALKAVSRYEKFSGKGGNL